MMKGPSESDRPADEDDIFGMTTKVKRAGETPTVRKPSVSVTRCACFVRGLTEKRGSAGAEAEEAA